MRSFLLTLLLVTSAGLHGPAVANETASANLDGKAILAQQAQIRAEAVAKKGRYKRMPEAKLNDLLAKQDAVRTLIGDKSLTTELNEVDQIALFNHLEAIEAIVNDAEKERMICERVKPVGSNRPQTVCKTAAERRADNEAAERQLHYRDSKCFKDSTGACL